MDYPEFGANYRNLSSSSSSSSFAPLVIVAVLVAVVAALFFFRAKDEDRHNTSLTKTSSKYRSSSSTSKEQFPFWHRSPTSPQPPPPPPSAPRDSLLQELWRGKGLLNTSLTLQQICPGFFGDPSPGVNPSKGCPTSADDCGSVGGGAQGVVDLSNFHTMANIVANRNNSISCFALATTLQNSRLAQSVFGPFPGGPGAQHEWISGDMTLGVFLDVRPLQKYIACMSPLDSGSVGRYGDIDMRAPQALQISSDLLSEGIDGVVQACSEYDECGLFMAGCGGSQGKSPLVSQIGTGYNFVDEAYEPPTYSVSPTEKWLPKGWLFLDSVRGTPGTVSFFKGTDKGLEAFEKTTRTVQEIVGPQSDPAQRQPGTQCQKTVMYNTFAPPAPPIPDPRASAANTCGDYWSYQYQPVPIAPWNNGDGYRENEVDIFIPQDKSKSQPVPGKPNMNCVPDQGFIEAFREAVVGVYATRFCAKDVPATSALASPCCNVEISKSLALALAKRHNSSPDAKRTIDAWYWDVVDPVGSWAPPSLEETSTARLNVTLITDASTTTS